MKNLYKLFSEAVLLSLMFTAAAAQKLQGEWKLVEARAAAGRVYLGRTVKTSLIFAGENRLSGNAGCNRYSTAYRLERNNGNKFEPIISTRKACLDNNFMKQETTFFTLMEKVAKFRIKGNELILSDQSGR